MPLAVASAAPAAALGPKPTTTTTTTTKRAAVFEREQLPQLRALLVHLVSDVMEAKPSNILEYMAAWAEARVHLREVANSTPSAAERSPTAPTPTAAAKAAAVECGDSPLCGETEQDSADSDAAAAMAPPEILSIEQLEAEGGAEQKLTELTRLAHRRVRRFSADASGCKNHYMMTLEESDCDLQYLRLLEAEMVEAKKRLHEVRKETEAILGEASAYPEHVTTIHSRYAATWAEEGKIGGR